MNQVATETPAKGRPAGLALASRSPVLGQFRGNPFRVLRVPIDVGVDQAIWKAEELLTRLRAGLPSPEVDLIPWLQDPDESEARQAIQGIEEPLRRLADQMFWFDPEHDPDGDLLRRGLASLDPAILGEYLARSEDDGLSRRPTVSIPSDGVFVITSDDVFDADGEPPEAAPAADGKITGVTAADVPRLLNQANLRLLLATLSLYDSLPNGIDYAGIESRPVEQSPAIDWVTWNGWSVAEDPHELDLTGGRLASRARRTVALWSDTLSRWVRLAGSPAFLDHVRESISRLDDEVVGEDDAEAIVNATSTRVIDLLVGEMKAQILTGRADRVKALVEAASSSEVTPGRWSQAFRPLKPLFRTDAEALEPLLPAGEDGSIADVSLYLARLATLKARWDDLDPHGHIGLSEIIDEADLKACEALARLESYATAIPIKALYGKTMGLASAESLKRKIAATVGRLDGFEHYTCYFCRSREMDPRRSVVITGKVESHRSYGFNSTTIHYFLKADLIPRCPRCSDLHQFFRDVAGTTWAALGVVSVVSLGVIYARMPSPREIDGVHDGFIAGIIAALICAVGYAAKWIVAKLATPKAERVYWKAPYSEKYVAMASGNAQMSIDYRREAFRLFEEQQAKRNSS